ncbi:right-handed parallel beta-helix repeat-containing protein [Methylomonas sp. 11b]|uniref:right-handed parallel beta-helix repeat-containing protein n=1 Tax=Methylomonas sp. 11b TaxID=1168169 RepID=UPI00047AE1D8|nr:right-handed parallel beta-helix repeat-containing protein [Methylomonas sp. 11b]
MLNRNGSTIALIFFSLTATAQDIYVSPTGSDKLNGLSPRINFWTKTGPFKTLARAQQSIRQIKAAGKFNQPITVHIGKGTYQLQAPLEFDDKDSGLPGQEVTWEGENGGSIISGGIALNNCQSYSSTSPNRILNCQLNASIASNISAEDNERISGNAPVFALFVDDIKMNLARWPDSDWAHIKLPLNAQTHFSVFEKMPKFTGDLSNAQVHIYPNSDYYDQYLGVEKVDTVNNEIILASQTKAAMTSGRRFYLQNFQSALNMPAEWFYDQSNARIQFIPPAGSPAKQVLISSLPNLMKLNSAKYINYRNLTFKYTNGNAITIDDSGNILLDNLEVRHARDKSILATESTDITISNSHLHDSGIGGILLEGGNRPNLQASGNTMVNNHIHDFDNVLLSYSPAIELSGVGGSVSYNLIENGAGSGINIIGNDHLVEKNEISDICKQSSDCGAIYSGRDWTFRGNIIRYNYVHDYTGYMLDTNTLNVAKNILQYKNDGARGIYLDDGVSGFTVFGNILVNAGMLSIQLGGGRDTLIENNVIKTDKRAIWVDDRGPTYNWSVNRESLASMPIKSILWAKKYPKLSAPMNKDIWPEDNIIRRNVIISTASNGYAIRYLLPKKSNIISNNIVWNAKTNIVLDYNILDSNIRGGSQWSNWAGLGFETNSLNTDPCINLMGSKINITCDSSPLSKIGFNNLPTDIGLIQ